MFSLYSGVCGNLELSTAPALHLTNHKLDNDRKIMAYEESRKKG
jgi:hypothetical protein